MSAVVPSGVPLPGSDASSQLRLRCSLGTSVGVAWRLQQQVTVRCKLCKMHAGS